MARLNAIGDVIVVTADITEKEYDSIEKHAPEALELKNEDGNTYFAVKMGDASISKYGICFSSRDTNGNIFMTTNNVITGTHDNIEKERYLIEEEFSTILANLLKIEEQVSNALEDVKRTISSVSHTITIEGEEVSVSA